MAHRLQLTLVGRRFAGPELKALGVAYECVADAEVTARAVAEASTARDGDPYYELLVAAMRGDAEAARPILLRCLGLSYTAEALLEDEDLGPALASPELASLRPLLTRSNSTSE